MDNISQHNSNNYLMCNVTRGTSPIFSNSSNSKQKAAPVNARERKFFLHYHRGNVMNIFF